MSSLNCCEEYYYYDHENNEYYRSDHGNCDKIYYTCIYKAIRNGHVNCLKKGLHNKIGSIDSEDIQYLYEESVYQHSIFKYFAENTVNDHIINDNDTSLLMNAIVYGDIRNIEYVILKYKNIFEYLGCILKEICDVENRCTRNDKLDRIKILLKYINSEKEKQILLSLTIWSGEINCLRYLIENNTFNNTLFTDELRIYYSKDSFVQDLERRIIQEGYNVHQHSI